MFTQYKTQESLQLLNNVWSYEEEVSVAFDVM